MLLLLSPFSPAFSHVCCCHRSLLLSPIRVVVVTVLPCFLPYMLLLLSPFSHAFSHTCCYCCCHRSILLSPTHVVVTVFPCFLPYMLLLLLSPYMLLLLSPFSPASPHIYLFYLLYLSSVKVCHVAGRRDAGSESLWLMYDPPPLCAVLVVQFSH